MNNTGPRTPPILLHTLTTTGSGLSRSLLERSTRPGSGRLPVPASRPVQGLLESELNSHVVAEHLDKRTTKTKPFPLLRKFHARFPRTVTRLRTTLRTLPHPAQCTCCTLTGNKQLFVKIFANSTPLLARTTLTLVPCDLSPSK